MDAGRLRWAALLDLVYFSLFGKFCLCFGCINFVGHVDQGHRKPVSQEACQVPREPVIDDLSSLYLELCIDHYHISNIPEISCSCVLRGSQSRFGGWLPGSGTWRQPKILKKHWALDLLVLQLLSNGVDKVREVSKRLLRSSHDLAFKTAFRL